MKTQSENINFEEDKMIEIILSDGSFEVNEELLLVVNEVLNSLNLSTIEDLKNISENQFFDIFTPLLNTHYNLK